MRVGCDCRRGACKVRGGGGPHACRDSRTPWWDAGRTNKMCGVDRGSIVVSGAVEKTKVRKYQEWWNRFDQAAVNFGVNYQCSRAKGSRGWKRDKKMIVEGREMSGYVDQILWLQIQIQLSYYFVARMFLELPLSNERGYDGVPVLTPVWRSTLDS